MSVAQYMIVEEPSSHQLTDRVHTLLGQGWQLQGGIAIRQYSNRTDYLQTMIKEDKAPMKHGDVYVGGGWLY